MPCEVECKNCTGAYKKGYEKTKYSIRSTNVNMINDKNIKNNEENKKENICKKKTVKGNTHKDGIDDFWVLWMCLMAISVTFLPRGVLSSIPIWSKYGS